MQDELFIEVDVFLSIAQLLVINESIIVAEECNSTGYAFSSTEIIPAASVKQSCPPPSLLLQFSNGSLIDIVSAMQCIIVN